MAINNQQLALLHRDLVEQEGHVETLVGQVGDLKTRLGSLAAAGQQAAWYASLRGWLQAALVMVVYLAPLLVTVFLVALSRSSWGWRRLPAAALLCLMVSLPGTIVGLLLVLGDTFKQKLSELLGSWPARMLGLGGLVAEERAPQQGSWFNPWSWSWWGSSVTLSGPGGAEATMAGQQNLPV